ASTVLGTFSAAGQNLFSKAQMELDNLVNLYQRTLDPAIGQTREQFHALREAAFRRIDSSVPAWLRRPLNLPATGEALKRRIGVEASQAVHGLRTATQGFRQFEIPTVSEAITRVGLAAKLTSIGSAVGVGLDTYATRDTIAEACSTGREEECRRIRYIEYGRLTGRTVGGIVGGSAAINRGVCLAVSLDPRGKLICGVVAAGSGAYGGSKTLEPFGEWLGSFAHRVIHGDENDDSN
ncbi:YtzC family protein, partial [Vreelandella olivaria]|uniref:YtzC family protein n=1 Tax=Vreelandella olivaria TaxID=390919 RepID=UPI00201EE7D3